MRPTWPWCTDGWLYCCHHYYPFQETQQASSALSDSSVSKHIWLPLKNVATLSSWVPTVPNVRQVCKLKSSCPLHSFQRQWRQSCHISLCTHPLGRQKTQEKTSLHRMGKGPHAGQTPIRLAWQTSHGKTGCASRCSQKSYTGSKADWKYKITHFTAMATELFAEDKSPAVRQMVIENPAHLGPSIKGRIT